MTTKQETCGVLGCRKRSGVEVVPVIISRFELTKHSKSQILKQPFVGVVKLPLCRRHREKEG